MRNYAVLVGALTSMSISMAFAADESFDIPNGEFSTLYSGALAPNTLISCEFDIEEAFYGDKWVPMVSILFSEADESDDDRKYFKLAANRSNQDKERGWRHEFRIQYADDRETITIAKSGTSENVLPMTMILDHDEYVLFFVGEEPDDMSIFDASTFSVMRWQVNVSGVKGKGDCDSRIIGKSDDG